MALFTKKEKEPQETLPPSMGMDELSEAERAALEAEAVLSKFDRESAFRNRLPKGMSFFIACVLIAFSLFQIYTSIWTIPAQQLRSIHLAFTLFLAFLLYPATRGLPRDRIEWYDYILSIIALCVVLYIPINYEYIIKNVGNFTTLDVIVGVVGILLLMEACRRVVGIPILIIVCVFLLYAKFGNLIPGTFGHRGYSVKQIINHMYFTLSGVFGTPLGVSSTFIFLFILFGSFLEKTGVGKLFIDLANAIAGRRVGGPAKVAVISSALQGTVSGSSVANTVSTGSFTIPAMKKLGYKPEFAGAVEAAASTGGQLMPPIMGAAAFLMAEGTGFTYAQVVKSAIIPAILYFSGILISVHHEARKIGLKGMPEEEIPKVGQVLKERGHLLLPLAFMIYMLASKVTPTYAALGAILTSLMACSLQWMACLPVAGMVVAMNFDVHFTQYAVWAVGLWILIALVRFLRLSATRDERAPLTIPQRIREALRFDPYDIIDGLKVGARNVLGVAIACAMAGMIVGTVTLTGLGLKFATGLARIAGNNLYLLLFLTMLSSIILGMGVPTTANYLITSTICAPAIITMVCGLRGIAVAEASMAIVMSAHLFVFYFGIIADITPPVALAAMAGSAIAKGEPFKTGVTATRIAIGAFIVPYIFVLNPAMLMIDTTFLEVAQNVCTALLGMYALSGGLAGFVQDRCTWYERVLLIGGGLGMIIPGTVSDLVGLAIVGSIIVVQKMRVKKREAGAHA